MSPQVIADYLVRTRWFGGKGRPFEVSSIETLGEVPGQVEDGPIVPIYLVGVTYADGDTAAGGPAETEFYQVPLSLYERPQGRLDHAFVGWWEDERTYPWGNGWVHAYDALHDREAMACWLRSFADPDSTSRIAFHTLPGHELDLTAHSTLFSGEQSNSSVAFGEDAYMKVFRKVTPGVNPDIQLHQVLTEVGSENVAALYGWVDTLVPESAPPERQEVLQLAMLQQFFRTATDGWDLALASVRALFGDPEVHASLSGGDFAGEASRLGEALAEVHGQLAEHFPTEVRGPDATAALADAMAERLERAVAAVPALGEYAGPLADTFTRVADLDSITVQRVHGDLHLGQTLRTSKGWKLVDFEGEPARPLAERMLPDSRWRDVAGMLRSFDYAPRSVEHAQVDDDPVTREQRRTRAEEWAIRNRNHFLIGYSPDGLDDDERVLLDAYVADKAVYEAVYEARNRPGWLDIPLAAVARLAEDSALGEGGLG